jgi:hypothetical protein
VVWFVRCDTSLSRARCTSLFVHHSCRLHCADCRAKDGNSGTPRKSRFRTLEPKSRVPVLIFSF